MTRLRNVDNSNQRVNDNKKAGYSFHGIQSPQHRVHIQGQSRNTRVRCNVQNFDNQVNEVIGAHMKEYRYKWQTTAGQS